MQQGFDFSTLGSAAAQPDTSTEHANVNDNGQRGSRPDHGGVLSELHEALAKGGPHE